MKKTLINLRPFAFASLLLVAVIFCGCEDENITANTITKKKGEVITDNVGFISVNYLNEFDYKGHTYISCKVRDGIALTHAGHCWCNGSKK